MVCWRICDSREPRPALMARSASRKGRRYVAVNSDRAPKSSNGPSALAPVRHSGHAARREVFAVARFTDHVKTKQTCRFPSTSSNVRNSAKAPRSALVNPRNTSLMAISLAWPPSKDQWKSASSTRNCSWSRVPRTYRSASITPVFPASFSPTSAVKPGVKNSLKARSPVPNDRKFSIKISAMYTELLFR